MAYGVALSSGLSGCVLGFVCMAFTWTDLFKDVSDIQNPKTRYTGPSQ